MRYDKALKIGRQRAEDAVLALRSWTDITTSGVCAVKPAGQTQADCLGDWQPVGEKSWKDICRHSGALGGDTYHLLVVDERDSVKACSCKRFDLRTVLALSERLPLPVAEPGISELWHAMRQQEDVREARLRVLHPDT